MLCLAVKDLNKTFKLALLGGKEIQALQEATLEVGEGSFLALLGESGSGKSSLLKCVYRTYLASAGEIWYSSAGGWLDLAMTDGRTILDLRRQEIGYVSQFFRPLPRITALDWVSRPLLELGVPTAAARDQAAYLLERLNIRRELWDAYPVVFSGGEQQRVNLAHALIVNWRLLLLDEPTAALDQANQQVVLELLQEKKRQGTTMIGVFHNPETFATLVDQCCQMAGGRILRQWQPGPRDWELRLAGRTRILGGAAVE